MDEQPDGPESDPTTTGRFGAFREDVGERMTALRGDVGGHLDSFREDVGERMEAVGERIEQLAQLPMLRGISHLIACGVAIVGAVLLVLHATGDVEFAASIVYGSGLALALGTSGVYHRFRSKPRAARVLRKLDHSMIFVLVASTYTPFVLVALNGGWRIALMVGVWVLATGGIILRLAVPNMSRAVLAAIYLGLGWTALGLAPALVDRVSSDILLLGAIGGVLYTLGALVYVLRRPDPIPRVFGFHEVFHVFVVAAAACHYAAVWPLLT